MALDLIFLLLFIWAAFMGFIRGFIMQIATLAALILGIICAVHFTSYISELYITKTGGQGDYLPIIVFTLIFVLILLGVIFIGKLMTRLVKNMSLGIVNRLLGMIFCMIKYAFFISITLVILNALDRTAHFLPEKKIRESHLYRPLSMLIPALFPKIFNTTIPPINLPDKAKQEKSV